MNAIFPLISQIVLSFASCPYDSWGSGCNKPKFMVDSKVCADGCPTLYYFYHQYFDIGLFNYCSKPIDDDAILFTLILSKVQDLTLSYVLDSADDNKKFVNPGGISYISGRENSPLPTLDRGYYFAKASSMTSNQSYTPGLYFILNLIIKPLESGEILNIQINSTQYVRIWIDTFGYYEIDLLVFNSNGAQIAVSGASSAKHSSSWHSVSVSLFQLSCEVGSINFYIDGDEVGTKILSNSEIHFPNGTYTWTFGNISGGNSFRGFIYWLQARADNNINYGIMTSTIGCPDNQYWDGSACQNCEIGCLNFPWCFRDNDCILCRFPDCSLCFGYTLSMCIEHYFNSQIPKTSRFVCSTGCQTCIGVYYHQCTSCQTGYYFLNIQCLSECPTGYTPNSSTNNCDYGGIDSYDFIFSKIILLDTISGIDVGSSNTNSYPNYDPNDPFPAYNRGYYFNPNSYVKTSYMHAPSSSIGAWIRPIAAGFVLIKYISTTTQWYVQILPSGQPIIYLLLSDSTTTLSVTGTSSVLNSWFYVSFNCSINTDGTTTANSYIDTTNEVTSSTATPLYLLDSLSGDLYLGHYSSGFTGFVWKIRLICNPNAWINFYKTTGCSGTCTKCPADSKCLDSCSINQYQDGSICKNCLATCTKGCRSSDTCSLCMTKECDTCKAFSGPNSCLTCIANTVSDGAGGCTCDTNTFWVSSSQSCEICDIFCSTCLKTAYFECSICSGSYNLIGNVCFDDCPYGFGTPPCSPVSTPVIDLSFDGNFQGSYGIFTTGTDPACFQFFDTPEAIDPVPAYKRGLFFDGNMYLAPSITPQLSHSFSFGAWIYVLNNGDWLQKLPDRLNYSSTGSFIISMENSNRASLSSTLSLTSPINSWKYLSVTSIYYLGDSTLTAYMNGASISSLLISNRLYRDISTSSLIIGKSSTSGFVGFIRTFQMWNVAITDFSSYIDAICGSGFACLWSCDLSHYYDGANCASCNSCSLGCVRESNCNICNDLLCSICTGFDSGKCSQCVTNASGAPNSCICNTGYMTSSDGFSCVECYTGCSQCTGLTSQECNACFSGYYFYAVTGECLAACPSGYFVSPGSNICAKCDNSCKTCTSPSHLDCLICDDYYYMASGICLSKPFFVNLIVHSNDSLSLNFSDPLQDSLSIDKIAISIENNPKFSWNLEQINKTYYSLPLSIKDEIPQNTVVNVTFIDLSEVKSIWNGTLNSSIVSSKLNEYDPNPYSLLVSQITSKITTVVQGSVIGSVVLSILNNNPSSLWGLINCLQILNYLSLSGIPFSNKMIQFLSSLNSYSLFPNLFGYLIDEKEGNKAYNEAKNFGYNTDLVLLNQGDDFTIIIASIVLFPCILYFSGCSYRIVGKKFTNIIRDYKFSFYIRFWIECYLELSAAAGVGLVMLRGNNIVQVTNLFICFLLYILSIASPPVFIWFSYKNRLKIMQKNRKFNLLFNSLFYEFRTEKGYRFSLYYFVFFLRRLIYITNLVFFSQYPKNQVSVNIICSIMSIIYLLTYWPFRDQILQISNVISEVLIGVIMLITSFYLFDASSSLIFGVENSIIFISMIIIGVQFCSSASIFVRDFYQTYRYKHSRHENIKYSVHPIKTSLDLIE